MTGNLGLLKGNRTNQATPKNTQRQRKGGRRKVEGGVANTSRTGEKERLSSS